jgi:hypothetical protein
LSFFVVSLWSSAAWRQTAAWVIFLLQNQFAPIDRAIASALVAQKSPQ